MDVIVRVAVLFVFVFVLLKVIEYMINDLEGKKDVKNISLEELRKISTDCFEAYMANIMKSFNISFYVDRIRNSALTAAQNGRNQFSTIWIKSPFSDHLFRNEKFSSQIEESEKELSLKVLEAYCKESGFKPIDDLKFDPSVHSGYICVNHKTWNFRGAF